MKDQKDLTRTSREGNVLWYYLISDVEHVYSMKGVAGVLPRNIFYFTE
jgi:hypothetical protein